MTGVHRTLDKVLPKELRSPIDRKIGKENLRTHESLSRRMSPQMPEPPRRPPNIDDATVRQQEADRLARRRGVLANIFGGYSGLQPTVAVKQLLGS